jgi:hypothetical protein
LTDEPLTTDPLRQESGEALTAVKVTVLRTQRSHGSTMVMNLQQFDRRLFSPARREAVSLGASGPHSE